MRRYYILASVAAGASLAGAKATVCARTAAAPAAGDGRNASSSKAIEVSGGAGSGKASSSYKDRLMRLVQLMDPRHALTTEEDIKRFRAILKEHNAGKKSDLSPEDVRLAAGEMDACCNPANGEVIPPPFRLSGFLLCNVPIVATMLFSKSVYVQVLSHFANQSLNTAVNYYNRSGEDMTPQRVALSYALAVGTACPLAFGLGKAFQRAPASLRRYSFLASYVAVAAAGSANVLFTRASEISDGVKVSDELGEVRGVSKEAGLQCVLQTVASRGMILPIPVIVIPAVLVGLLERQKMMPASPRARMWVQVAIITASLAFALPVSIAVFPQEARFKATSLEPELHSLVLKDGSKREATYLYANKGL